MASQFSPRHAPFTFTSWKTAVSRENAANQLKIKKKGAILVCCRNDSASSGCSAAWLARLTGGQKVVSSTLIIPTIFLCLSHHSPPDDAFFISLYIPFNPRVVQRIFRSKILRRETFSAPFGCRRTHSPPEILRLRKGAPSRFFELRRKVRADSPTATICLRNSAYMIFRFWGYYFQIILWVSLKNRSDGFSAYE